MNTLNKVVVCFHETRENLNSEMPNARTNSRIVNIDPHRLLLFGGIGNDTLNDMRVYDYQE